MFQLSSEPSNRRPEAAAPMLDEMDVKILRILQQDCTRSVADIGKEVGLSTTPCWRRIQKLEEAGVIQRRVAILDAPASTPASPCSCRSRPTSIRSTGWSASTAPSSIFPRWSSSTA